MNDKTLIVLSVSILLSVVVYGLFFSNHYTLQEWNGVTVKLDQRSGEVWMLNGNGGIPIKFSN
jgi:hypothetical protein